MLVLILLAGLHEQPCVPNGNGVASAHVNYDARRQLLQQGDLAALFLRLYDDAWYGDLQRLLLVQIARHLDLDLLLLYLLLSTDLEHVLVVLVGGSHG